MLPAPVQSADIPGLTTIPTLAELHRQREAFAIASNERAAA
jgi:hypothetical protein